MTIVSLRAAATACALAVSLCAIPAAHADTIKTEAEIRPLADKIMALAGAGRTDDAYGAMSPYALVDIRTLETARMHARGSRMAIEAQLGASIGYEFIRAEKLGDSLIKLSYIEKTERQAVPWQFIFYRTQAGWGISAFSNGDDVNTLFLR